MFSRIKLPFKIHNRTSKAEARLLSEINLPLSVQLCMFFILNGMSIPMSMGMEMGMENPLNKEKRKKPTPGELMFNLHAMTYP